MRSRPSRTRSACRPPTSRRSGRGVGTLREPHPVDGRRPLFEEWLASRWAPADEPPGPAGIDRGSVGRSTMKTFLFWTAVIAGILAAVAVMMKRRSGHKDGSWEYLEDPKGLVTKAVNDTLSGPDVVERA